MEARIRALDTDGKPIGDWKDATFEDGAIGPYLLARYKADKAEAIGGVEYEIVGTKTTQRHSVKPDDDVTLKVEFRYISSAFVSYWERYLREASSR